jgi:type I restriction enzyme M protein
VYPSLKSDLFAHLRDGYSKLNVEASEIKNTIYNHPEFSGYSDKLNSVFTSWKDKVYQNLKNINETTAPKKLVDLISETLLDEYHNKPLVDKYNMYQHLMDYWNDIMKDDVYLLVEDGWVAKTKRVLEKNQKGKEVDKGWTCDLIPKELVINRFLKDDLQLVLDCESKIEALKSEITTLTEENGGEEDALNEVTKVKEAKDNLEDFLGLAYDAYAKDINKDRISLLNNLSDELEKLKVITSNPELEALKNANGTITKKAVTEKLKSIKDTSNAQVGNMVFLGDDYQVLNDWIHTTKEVASIKKEIKLVTQTLGEIIEGKINDNKELEYLKEIDIIYSYIDLHIELTSAKKEMKEASESLDIKTLEQYSNLTEADLRTLVVDDKWIASLSSLMQSEIDAISQRLTGRIKELADRYEHTLGELTTSTKTLEENVSAHLEKMGLVWS